MNLLKLFNKIILLIISFSISCKALCQDANLSERITEIAEELVSEENDVEAVSVYVERLQELAENPVNINSADESELSHLFFLNDFQIRSLKNHTKTSGRIVSTYEIASIPGFDQATAETMIPFISLRDSPDDSSYSVKWRNTILTNLSIKPGETDTNSIGSQLKVLTKYKLTAGRFSAGFTSEKDQGEKFLTGSPPVPDFFSGFIFYSGKGIIKKIVAGDFSARFGQGTNINSGMRTSLQVTSAGYMPGRDEIRPYTSTDENNFFRGAAATLSLKYLECSLFFSHNKADATLGLSSDSASYYVENLYASGLHNTSLLLLKKDPISSICWGADLTIDIKSLRIGMVWSENRFSLPFASFKNIPEDLYGFTGRINSIYTLYYNGQFRRFLVYGELTCNNFSRVAFIQGVNVRPSDRLTINFLYRNYMPDFTTFYGKGPGYGTSTCNEEGLLGNFTFEAAKHFFIMAGSDICRFPWLKYRCSSPTISKRYEVRLRYVPNEKITFDLTYYYRFWMTDDQPENGIPLSTENITRAIKGTVKYSLQENLTLSTRIDLKKAEPDDSKGMLILQDLAFRFRKLPVTIWLRYCIFYTDDWKSRLYTYENDLLYSFSIPALAGEGTRSYALAKWDIGDRVELRIKYGLTSILEHGNIVNDKDEVKLQFRMWF
jgi:hypothetical protein